jgi:hypothetical protein
MDWYQWELGLGRYGEEFPESFGLLDDLPHRFEIGPDTYGDWWDHDRLWGDNRDVVDDHFRNIWTGLPPKDHQGVEYTRGPHPMWPDTNGDGGCGSYIHINAPVRDAHRPAKLRMRRAFIWPSDGKRKSTWGRWKDLGSGKGPDIYVAPLSQRPTRNHWKNRMQDINLNEQGEIEAREDARRAMPWARRDPDEPYDFRTREFRKDKPGVWAEAVWPRYDADQFDNPLSYRCRHGDWYNTRWAPFGGVPLPQYNFHRNPRKGLGK